MLVELESSVYRFITISNPWLHDAEHPLQCVAHDFWAAWFYNNEKDQSSATEPRDEAQVNSKRTSKTPTVSFATSLYVYNRCSPCLVLNSPWSTVLVTLRILKNYAMIAFSEMPIFYLLSISRAHNIMVPDFGNSTNN